jgi:NTP pyrophosphatase (non-canonical NTP hydrolase)
MSDPASTPPSTHSEFLALRDALRAFAAERDWDQFHSPKNLAMSVAIEAAELMEHFQWRTEEQSRALDDESRRHAADEMADVLLYLVRLADKLGVDLNAAAYAKIEQNSRKYPADKARGRMVKYDRL